MTDQQPTFPLDTTVTTMDVVPNSTDIDTLMPMFVKIAERIYRDYGIVFDLSNLKVQTKLLTLYNKFMDLDFEEHAVSELTRKLEHQYFDSSISGNDIDLGAVKRVQKVEIMTKSDDFQFLEIPGVETKPRCENPYHVFVDTPFDAQYMTLKYYDRKCGYLVHVVSTPIDYFTK